MNLTPLTGVHPSPTTKSIRAVVLAYSKGRERIIALWNWEHIYIPTESAQSIAVIALRKSSEFKSHDPTSYHSALNSLRRLRSFRRCLL